MYPGASTDFARQSSAWIRAGMYDVACSSRRHGPPQHALDHPGTGAIGAPSPKPTTLMVLGLHGLEDDLRGGRVTSDNPRGLSVGKDAAGQYSTAPLKEYPPAMCRALATAFPVTYADHVQGSLLLPPIPPSPCSAHEGPRLW